MASAPQSQEVKEMEEGRELYEVGFKGERRGFFLNPQNVPVSVGDAVIVEADRGVDLGYVLRMGKLVWQRKPEKLGNILRKATPEEVASLAEKAKKEEEAFRACREKIAQHGLKMKLVDVEYQFDGKKITFYFTAERRVDFRDLVRDLAKYFHTRVELRQIGVRDEAKWVGGYGPCGRRLCCAAFLREFESVSSQMAKLQNLCVSPDKISGLCGRLMCCLLFEREFYEEVARKFPKVGSKVSGEDGRIYEVSKVDIFRDRIYLKNEVGMELQMSSEELSRWRRPLRRLLGRIRRRGDE
ncbi:MAG: hypothetical protein DRQ08_01335 [Candidatus Latescibacterota bacterium]|nr:MAG: hypothetical protein DRQ08_01335 [Candidatus Latescibacterota bacterium]